MTADRGVGVGGWRQREVWLVSLFFKKNKQKQNLKTAVYLRNKCASPRPALTEPLLMYLMLNGQLSVVHDVEPGFWDWDMRSDTNSSGDDSSPCVCKKNLMTHAVTGHVGSNLCWKFWLKRKKHVDRLRSVSPCHPQFQSRDICQELVVCSARLCHTNPMQHSPAGF